MRHYSLRTFVFNPTTFDQVVRISFKVSNSNFIYLHRFSIESWFYSPSAGVYNSLDCLAYIRSESEPQPLGQVFSNLETSSSVGDIVTNEMNRGYPMATGKVPYVGKWPMPFGGSGVFFIEIQYMIPLGSSYPLLTWFPYSQVCLDIEDTIPKR